MLPAGASLVNSEVLKLDVGRKSRWRDGEVRQLESGKSPLDELRNKFLGAYFDQARGALDELGLSDGTVDAEDPARAAERSLVDYCAVVKIARARSEGNADAVARYDQLEMRA